MIKTYGLTHIALAVADVERSLRFYSDLFGAQAYFREPGRIHVKIPGTFDIITFDQTAPNAGQSSGMIHFGFRLTSPDDIESAVAQATAAGATSLRRGEFAPGYPYVYFHDPDGYEIEVWFE